MLWKVTERTAAWKVQKKWSCWLVQNFHQQQRLKCSWWPVRGLRTQRASWFPCTISSVFCQECWQARLNMAKTAESWHNSSGSEDSSLSLSLSPMTNLLFLWVKRRFSSDGLETKLKYWVSKCCAKSRSMNITWIRLTRPWNICVTNWSPHPSPGWTTFSPIVCLVKCLEEELTRLHGEDNEGACEDPCRIVGWIRLERCEFAWRRRGILLWIETSKEMW